MLHFISDPGIFESAMLICFGCAWPASIYKSYTSRSNKGKSLYFLYILLIGYINGIIYQHMISPAVHYVLYFFYVNTCLVFIDIVLYYRNWYLEKKNNKLS